MFLIFWLLVNHRSIYFDDAANETLERLASFGLTSNFMVYMVREYHMDQVQAAALINTWSALTNFAPIIGAFISDSCTGKFVTIVLGSISELLVKHFLMFFIFNSWWYHIVFDEICDRLYPCMFVCDYIVLVDHTPIDLPDSLVNKSSKCHS